MFLRNFWFNASQGIAFDAASSSGYEASLSTYNWSHTCTGNNRILFVGVSIFAAGSVTSITYNGVNLTFIRSDVNGVYKSELWYLVAPATGSNSIVVTLDASLTSIASAVSYTGVHQTSPIEANAGANGTGAADASVDVTTVADADWVVDNVSTQDGAITVGTGNTSRANNSGALGSGAMGDTNGPKSPAGAVTMSWTDIAALQSWAISATAIRPDSAAALPGTGGGDNWPLFQKMGFWNWRFSCFILLTLLSLFVSN